MKRIEIYIGLSVFALSAKSQVKESRPNVMPKGMRIGV